MAPSTTHDALVTDATAGLARSAAMGGHDLLLGAHLAGQRVTARLDGHPVHVIAGGVLVKTLPSPIPVDQRG